MEVDSVICHWLSLKMEDNFAIHDGLGMAVGRSMGLLCADDGLIGSQDLEWIQGTINVLIGLLHGVGLVDNVAKSNTMT